ncbi:hypothetical protein E4S40_07185 [Algoriphagus kandeliae]|uniref:Outer membrane protein beta-barrel domain-containing protein n=1 Tax=Algoriphagus kandeliae TaxID=2562278 RepID=A0A4Y9QWJ5_9BACT|nr:hypothetical protein [Algoriphagus kandeliae]TFV96002.1 hypothetical protein E4S40_07185 [Algoriphagus kandeliae]
MKKTILLLFFALLPLLVYSQEKQALFFEIDGNYWEKSLSYPQLFAPEKERFGGARLFFGLPMGEKWSIGLMGSYQAYYEAQENGSYNRELYGPEPDENGNPIIIGTSRVEMPVGLQNDLFGLGLFLQRRISLGKRTTLAFNFYGIRESGKGQLEIFPDYSYLYWPCPNCLSIAPGPIIREMEEKNWKAGIDISFAWSLNDWMDLGIRANFLEFRKRTLSNNSDIVNTLVYDPLWALADGYTGDRYDFGSAVSREGVRISLTLRPF